MICDERETSNFVMSDNVLSTFDEEFNKING